MAGDARLRPRQAAVDARRSDEPKQPGAGGEGRAVVQDRLLAARAARERGVRPGRPDQPVGLRAAQVLAQGRLRAGQPPVLGAAVGAAVV
eukprot:3831523-Prymnesium_polylepis.1